MKRLSMLAAVSALALTSASAHAGALQLKIKNINGNGNEEFDDGIDTATGVNTLDRPSFVIGTIVTPDPNDPHADPIITQGKIKGESVILANERTLSEDHPLEAHIELNATRFDFDGDLVEVLPDQFLLELSVSNAVFKVDLNGEDLIRNGMMGEGNLNADVLGLTGEAGTSFAEVFVENIPDNGNQTDFGLLLPLRITGGDNDESTPCVDVQASVQLFSTEGINGPSPLGAPDIITLLSCRDSFGSTFDGDVVKVDFQTDFKGFLTAEEHTPVQSIAIGDIYTRVWNNTFDVKAAIDSDDRTIGSEDIASQTIVLQFEDLTGISEVNLTGDTTAGAILNRAANTATFVISGDDGFEVSETITDDIDHDGEDEDTDVEDARHVTVELVAFGEGVPKFIKGEELFDDKGVSLGKAPDVPTGNGAIQHQIISIVSNTLRLNNPCKEDDGTIVGGAGNATQPKFWCNVELETGDLAELTLTGQNFGPFDWVAQGNANVLNFFRVSHLPLIDGHGNPLESLKGIMTLKNSTGNGAIAGQLFDNVYKFDLPIDPTVPNQGANGVYLIGPGTIAGILAGDGAPSIAFGNTDISFTFFVNSVPGSGQAADPFAFSENFKIDVDRLMLSNGVFSEYGDNANDSNSEHAVSGDTGRFGPRVPLKLKASGTDGT